MVELRLFSSKSSWTLEIQQSASTVLRKSLRNVTVSFEKAPIWMRLTFYSLCLDELSKWISRTHYGDIVRWQTFLFLPIRRPTPGKCIPTALLGQVCRWRPGE